MGVERATAYTQLLEVFETFGTNSQTVPVVFRRRSFKTHTLTQARVVLAVLSVGPAVLLAAAVAGHGLQLDLLGQGGQFCEEAERRHREQRGETERKKERKKREGINKGLINGSRWRIRAAGSGGCHGKTETSHSF